MFLYLMDILYFLFIYIFPLYSVYMKGRGSLKLTLWDGSGVRENEFFWLEVKKGQG